MSQQAPLPEEQVILVDLNDNTIATMGKLQAHQEGLCHRAFSVFVLRKNQNQTETLLQQRHQDKYHCGGLWTNTCCSHPRPGEDTRAAAQRRLTEEMGLQLSLREVGVFHYIAHFANGLTENEVDHVFVGLYDEQAETGFKPDPQEVMASRWVSLEALETELQATPELFTPWLTQALGVLKKSF